MSRSSSDLPEPTGERDPDYPPVDEGDEKGEPDDDVRETLKEPE